MSSKRFSCACFGVALIAGMVPLRADDATEFFESRIRPLLIQKCAECHTGETPEGDLKLDSRKALLKGGMSGPALVERRADASPLLQRVISTDPKKQMPPEERLSDSEIADLRKWIDDGATWPDGAAWKSDDEKKAHWAFQPVKDVAPPEVANKDWCRTPIDQFIAAEYEKNGIVPSPAADKRTLIRRATLDLTGLPPRIEDVDAFLADDSADAFAKVVDRLLASSEYGERWGRHWLDQARYADTSGDGTDTPIPEARYYRNYVIKSINNDLPWNQFLMEQVAGDLMAKQHPENPRANEQIIATGYVALSRRFGNSAFASMELIIDDSVDTIGKSMLGLTLGCARCHHHKFDPVTMNDYYGIYGYFENTQYPHAGTEHQKERSHFVSLTKNEAWPAAYESTEAWAISERDKQTGDTNIRIGGDTHQKGEKARRGYLSVINNSYPEIPEGNSGRLQFAQWLGSNDNPLTTRVAVNRVWQYHFGRGIVESSSNFGVQGAKPSHPELLDWLARDFVRQGWSLKALHRQIMLSSVYQLSSQPNEVSMSKDQANRTWWRFDRHRMDAETIRDSLLSISLLLQPGENGRHPFKPTPELKYNQGHPFDEIYDHKHRSVYLMSGRLNKHPFMALFDGPDPNKTTENRRESTVALQALYVMNSPFMKETSEAFASRLMSISGETPARLDQAWQLACSRFPSDDERADAEAYLADYRQQMIAAGKPESEADRMAWTSFARALLSSNEFLYVD
ncbi:MAG: PSD1 domain-containing protein [Planctomycetaceae bacterium]|nr:PSD1 domain-containing protein [Planctomycetaceae bacterium]